MRGISRGPVLEGRPWRCSVRCAGGWERARRVLVVAGGETSGAVVQKLGVAALGIGPEIAPGVPWTLSLGRRPLALALKSGNFGSDDFFEQAFALYPKETA